MRGEKGVAVVTHPDIRWGRCDIKTVGLLANVGVAALLAFVGTVLLVGLWLSGWLSRRVDAHMARLNVEVTLRSFLRSLISLALKVLVVITVASMLGVATTSFIAVLGAAACYAASAIAGRLLLSSINSMSRWHKPGGPLSAHEVVEQFLDIILVGLRTP